MIEPLEVYLLQVQDKNPTQAAQALASLALFSDVRALTAIQTAFFHPNQKVRAAAAQAAGINLDSSLFEALLSLQDDPEPEVRLAAVLAMGKYANKGHQEQVVLELLKHQPDPQTALAVRDIIRKAGNLAISLLELELVSFDEKRRERAIEILPDLGDLGMMAVIAHIPELQKADTYQAARALGKLDHPMLVNYFHDMLSSPDPEKRLFALLAINNGSKTEKTIPMVGDLLLNEPEQNIRLQAALCLSSAKNPATLPYFKQYDPFKEKGIQGKWIREIVRDGLMLLELQTKELPELFELLFVGEPYQRPLVAEEFSRREDPLAIPYLTRALLLDKTHDAQAHILASLGNFEAVEAVDEILALLERDITSREDALALEILGDLYHPKALDTLKTRAEKTINNDFPSINSPIIAARKAIDTIHNRLGFLNNVWISEVNKKEDKLVFIGMLLAQRGDSRGLDLLMKVFKKTNTPAIRYQICRALGGSASVFVLPFLLEILQSNEERLVWHAILAIGQLRLKEAPLELSALMLEERVLVRSAILFAYGKLQDPKTLPIILRRLADPHPHVRALAVQTLGMFAFDESWLSQLEPLCFDPSIWARLETARLLGREGKAPSIQALIKLLIDPHPDIRLSATFIAQNNLSEALRPALETCVSMKGSHAKRKAKALIERLDWIAWQKDPQVFQQKQKEAEAQAAQKAREKALRALRQEAFLVLKSLKLNGWQSCMVTHVAGAAYIDWESLYADLHAGEFLQLVREPGNPHDEFAIMVTDEPGNKMGYIPRFENKALARQLDEGRQICAVVLQVKKTSRVWQLYIEVFLRG